jgi:hypothetical protein
VLLVGKFHEFCFEALLLQQEMRKGDALTDAVFIDMGSSDAGLTTQFQ